MTTAQALSGMWMIAGAIVGMWIGRRWLGLGIVPCAIFVAAFGGSAEVLSWAASPHSTYMASISMGGVVLAIILALGKCDLQPTPMLAVFGAFGFALACLYSPVQGFLIGGGLLVVLLAPFPQKKRLPIHRRALIAICLGLPAACICVGQILLFPHIQIGSPPSYAHHYLFGLSGEPHGPIAFLLSRSWYLCVQVFSVEAPRNRGLEFQGVLMLLFAGVGTLTVLFRSAPRSWRLLILIVITSLIPAAALSLISWYPFGYVRYEYYAVIPISLLSAIGAAAIWRALGPRLVSSRVRMAVVWVLLGTTAAIFLTSWSIRTFKVWRDADKGQLLLDRLDMELARTPSPAFITDYWSNTVRYLINERLEPDFVIKRSVLVHQRGLSRQELNTLRSILLDHKRVVLLISGSNLLRNRQYVDLVPLLESSGFMRSASANGDDRLTVWNRGQSDLTPFLGPP